MGWRLVLVACAGCGFHANLGGTDAAIGDARELDARTDGLVAWYRMDAPATPAEDATGNGHDGTCTACPQVVSGKIASAFGFDRATQRVDVVEESDLVTTTGLTVALWVRFDSLPDGFACAIGKGQITGIYNTWQLCYDAQTSGWFVGTYGAAFDTMRAFPGPTTARWYHVAITWDGAAKALWIDGVRRVDEPQTSLAFDGRPLTIGADIDNGSHANGIDGTLDDVRIYNRPLTADEITALATL